MTKEIIKRSLELGKMLKKGRAAVIYGPRRAGKTTLLNDFLQKSGKKYKLDSGDNRRIKEIMSSEDFDKIKEYASGYEILAIDEAQKIPGIGQGLKILTDQLPELAVIATGSSSFELSQQIGEPLTGRKRTAILHPFSQIELSAKYNKFELKEKLAEFLVFGAYPEVITAKTKKEKIAALQEINDSYLLKDIFSLEKIKASKQLSDLLKLLAFQAGGEVSLNELATQVKLDVKTVDRYLDILEKAFVIKRLTAFSRNLRNEITTKNKYYFLDNGIRNAVISQFNDLENRNDVGQLFENFAVMERIKNNAVKNRIKSVYFWRSYSGEEIDYIEEGNGKLQGYEFKWAKNKAKKPKLWLETYSGANWKIINKDNYLDFIL